MSRVSRAQDLVASIECATCETAEHMVALCRSCGQVHEHQLIQLLIEQQEHIENAELELRRYRSKVKRLQAEGDTALHQQKCYPDAKEVLEFWRDTVHPNAREIEGGERLKNVVERLSGKHGKPYTADELKEAVIGYAHLPYVVNGRRMSHGSPAQRRIDAELIFRDPGHVDQGRAFADEAVRRSLPVPTSSPTPPQQNGKASAPVHPNLGELGQGAFKWANFGFYVFPVAIKGKTPVTANGLLDATLDIERITRHWKRYPQHNIGMRCGIESNLVVLDVDGDEGFESLRLLEDRFEKLPLTASIVTPRGGQHFYFRHPGQGEVRNTTGYPGPGLDVRGDGGYVLGPPSIGANDKHYEVDESAALAPLPKWLLNVLVERQVKPKIERGNYMDFVSHGVTEGERNGQLLSLTGAIYDPSKDLNLIFELVYNTNLARCKPPLDRKEVEKIVQSVAKMRQREALKGLVE